MTDDDLDALFDLPFTLSLNCVSGLVPKYAERCECWRCRKGRDEPADEALAERVARAATESLRAETQAFLEARR